MAIQLNLKNITDIGNPLE